MSAPGPPVTSQHFSRILQQHWETGPLLPWYHHAPWPVLQRPNRRGGKKQGPANGQRPPKSSPHRASPPSQDSEQMRKTAWTVSPLLGDTARVVTISSSALRFYLLCFTTTPAALPPKKQAACRGHSFHSQGSLFLFYSWEGERLHQMLC